MSRIADFYRNPDKDFSKFFDSKIETDKIAEVRKEINSLQLKLNHKMDDLQNLYGTMYGADFVPNNNKVYVRYSGRSNSAIFSLDTFKEVADMEKDSSVITLDGKDGVFTYLIGYSYKYGSVILRTCDYKVSPKCDSIKIVPKTEYIVSIIENKDAVRYDYRKQETTTCRSDISGISRALEQISAKEFLNEMYEIDRDFNFNLNVAINASVSNKAFEVIIKTCPIEIMRMAFSKKTETSCPMHVVMEIDKTVYEGACQYGENEEGFLTFFFEAFNKYKCYAEAEKNVVNFNKTDKQFYDLAVKAWNLKKDMDFYSVCNVSNYMTYMVDIYMDKNYHFRNVHFYKHYPFGKFITYVANETINQGYSRVENFVTELKDYITMTESSGGIPTLYSSYLKLTHDIATRNMKIFVSEENEALFKKRYEDISGYIIDDYSFICPSNTNEVKDEGNKLNHCVASYINRVIKGECIIMFMRLTKSLKESLVTLEIEGGRVAQARGMSNRNVTPEEHEALVKFCKKACLEIDE